MLISILAISLGVFFIIEVFKHTMSVRLMPLAKLLAVLVLSTCGGVYHAIGVNDPFEGVAVALGVAGASVLVHAAHKAMGAVGDANRIEALRRR